MCHRIRCPQDPDSLLEDTEKLQADLGRIVQWSEANNMQLHEDKFEFLCYRTKQTSLLKQLPYTGQHTLYQTPKGHTLYPQVAVKDLGVILASDYSWSYHINTMVADARIMAVLLTPLESTHDTRCYIIN